MSQQALLERLIQKLEKISIPYMITGSLGSSFYGRARATNDIDVVIAPAPEQLDELVRALGEEFYVSPTAAAQAQERRSMFNVIDYRSGWKADIILRKDRPFSVEEFARRQTVNLMGLRVTMVSAEDAMLTKLEWSKESASQQQINDAVGIALVQRDELDCDYLRKWARELGVAEQLEGVLHHVKELLEQEP